MEYMNIRVEIEGGIATLTLNRPEYMNAWNLALANDLNHALDFLDKDDSVRAIVVTGAGRAFCAGADFKASFFSEEKSYLSILPCQLSKPVIAAINGHAIGVGITLAIACDIRFVAEDAKIQFAFVRRGMIPALAAHVILARIAGLSDAADLLLTGRMITGRELADMRLATKALPSEDVLPAALERAREFLKAAPVSVAISKHLLWEGLTSSVLQMYRHEKMLFEWISRQTDAAEGVASFLEKRDPKWTMSVNRDLPEILTKIADAGRGDWADEIIKQK